MTGDDAALLATLPAWAFAFVLVMARVGAAVTLLPGLGEPSRRRWCASASPRVTVLLLPGHCTIDTAVPEAGVPAAVDDRRGS